jgi:hypothetical protein
LSQNASATGNEPVTQEEVAPLVAQADCATIAGAWDAGIDQRDGDSLTVNDDCTADYAYYRDDELVTERVDLSLATEDERVGTDIYANKGAYVGTLKTVDDTFNKLPIMRKIILYPPGVSSALNTVGDSSDAVLVGGDETTVRTVVLGYIESNEQEHAAYYKEVEFGAK